MNPDQTSPLGADLIWVHIVCNVSHLTSYADERADDKRQDWRDTG